MRVLVTGAAGFIGSHLVGHLLDQGYTVTGVDSFTDYYDPARKRANVARFVGRPGFQLVEQDLLHAPLQALLHDVDVVFHLAAQPGVRKSWGEDFAVYVERNILATQRLLEAARDRPLRKFVAASSSSVYGDAEAYPTAETVLPRPVSPYGVTKLAAEHLCELYRTTCGVPTVSLRFFTVYGPGQRPDMAFSRIVGAAVRGTPFHLFGDGTQTRDFTYVDDVVTAMVQSAFSDWTGVANIGGGARTSMAEVLDLVRSLAGSLEVIRLPAQRGDVRHTGADTTMAAEAFGYAPSVSLAEGLARMVAAERDAVALAAG